MSRGKFEGYEISGIGPALGAFAVTPGPTALASPIRFVTINGAGVIEYTSSVDGQDYTTNTLPVGTHVFFASHILAGGTTATGITGWI